MIPKSEVSQHGGSRAKRNEEWHHLQTHLAQHVSFSVENANQNAYSPHISHRTNLKNSQTYTKCSEQATSPNSSTIYNLINVKTPLIPLLTKPICVFEIRFMAASALSLSSNTNSYQNLGLNGLSGPGNIFAAAAANHHHQNLGFNFIGSSGGGVGGRDQYYHHHHNFFPRDQQQVIRSFDGGNSNNYDASSLLAMNVSASIGQLSQFQHPRAAGGEGRRTTIEPS
ncbi:hypothetical protein M9H77_36229 [Catharanthus roseus]|uniref:Uncharacterized protein n=1 Tax=Catharanthus roseus TaxID=4058 RepID=A0ACB9ZR90_CATRO|nr:hypothetical protein M9H77_36229 [Catharanthus roseus]